MTESAQKISIASMIHNLARTKAADTEHNVAKALPCHISAIKSAASTSERSGGSSKNESTSGATSMGGDFYEITFDVTNTVFTLPKIIVPQLFSKYTREPTQVGDKGYVVPNDIHIGGSDGVDGSTANMYQRGNLTTGVFHPVASTKWDQRDPNKYYHTGGPSGWIARSHDYSTYNEIDKLFNINHFSFNNITHAAQQLMQHTAQEITHVAQQTLTDYAENTINHIAKNSITHAVLNGTLQLLQNQLTIGKPNTSSLFEDTKDTIDTKNGSSSNIPGNGGVPSVPSIPSIPSAIESTLVNVLGHISASGSISAGNMSSGGAQVMTQPVPPQLVNAPVIVTGAKGGNTALGSLIAALVTLGLIVDHTTA